MRKRGEEMKVVLKGIKIKWIYKFVLFLSVLMIFYFTGFAGSPGTSGALFLNYSPSARATAMANSYSSLSDDVFSIYYNPSGLGYLDLIQGGVSYTKSFQDISNQYIAIGYPYKIGQVFAFSYHSLSNGDIEGFDAKGSPIGKIDTSNYAITFGYGKVLAKDEIERPVLNVGANLKYISQTLDNVSANTFAFDLGFLYTKRPDKYWLKDVPAQEFNFAAVLKNVGPPLKFDKEGTPLPISLTLGTSWISHPWTKHRLVLSFDTTLRNDDKVKFSLGAEYFLFQLLFARVGIESSKDIGSKLNFGFGFRLSYLDVNYSLADFGDLGKMNKVDLVLRFGFEREKLPLKGEVARVEKAKIIAPKEKIEKLEMFASDFIKLAENNIERGDYLSARDNITKAFNLEPSLKNSKWGKIYERIDNLIGYLKLEKRKEKITVLQSNSEQAGWARDVIKSYLNMEDKKSYLMAHIMYGVNPKGDSIFEEILNFIARENGLVVRTDELLTKDSWVIYKLKKSANYFYLKQYHMVVEECREILMIDENNHVATVRLGSAYFMLGDKENAKLYYEKALKLNPDDKVTLEFMKKQGWR